jgi:guanylate kinase
VLYEAIDFLFAYVDGLNLHDKDVFIVVGPSRTGKGTLLAALKGQKMKLFRRKAKDR